MLIKIAKTREYRYVMNEKPYSLFSDTGRLI